MKKVLIIIGLFILFTGLLQAQNDEKKEIPNAPEITFTSLEHDYGTIVKGADGNCEFHFRNTGKEPLILSNVRSSCGCTVPSWTKEPVMPGKEGIIKVTYNTTRIGPISKTITVESNGKTNPVMLHIKGTVQEIPGSNGPEKPMMNDATPIAR